MERGLEQENKTQHGRESGNDGSELIRRCAWTAAESDAARRWTRKLWHHHLWTANEISIKWCITGSVNQIFRRSGEKGTESISSRRLGSVTWWPKDCFVPTLSSTDGYFVSPKLLMRQVFFFFPASLWRQTRLPSPANASGCFSSFFLPVSERSACVVH